MKLIACGDSWAWGAELVDPIVTPFTGTLIDHQIHFIPENIDYRLKNKYTALFADKIGADEIIDLSQASYSNDAIVRTLIRYLAVEGYLSGKNTDEIFVSIGWTSPERKEFQFNGEECWGAGSAAIYTDGPSEIYTHHEKWIQAGPWIFDLDYKNDQVNEFFKLLISSFWSLPESMNRYFTQVKMVESLLKSNNIKYVMHQAFYHVEKTLKTWNDSLFKAKVNESVGAYDHAIYHSVDNIRFINKDDAQNPTFYKYILNQAEGDFDKVFMEWHPNALGHKIWAEYMYQYCVDNKLL